MARKVVSKTKVRRTPKILTHTLYVYTRAVNGKYAREFGRRNFGSFSNYLDTLITLDRAHHFSKQAITDKKTAEETKAA